MSIFEQLEPVVELFYNRTWNNITGDVRGGKTSGFGIDIERGRSSEQENVGPSQCRLTLNNCDGRYSPRNPTSDLFGLIKQNTPMRVRVNNELFERAPAASVRAVQATDSIAESFSVDTPAGTVEGDILVAFITASAGSLNDLPLPLGSLSASSPVSTRWTEIDRIGPDDPDEDISGTDHALAKVFWKVVGSNDPGAGFPYTFFQNSVSNASVVMVTIQDASHARPVTFSVDSIEDPSAGTTVQTQPTIPGANNVELRWAAGYNGSSTTWMVPAGFTEEAEASDVNDATAAVLASRQISTLNSTGEHTFTASTNLSRRHSFTVNVLSDTSPIRSVTEVASWPLRWNLTEQHSWVPLEGSGIIRRLTQGAAPLNSAAYRGHFLNRNTAFGPARRAFLVGYWPLEDGAGALGGSSPLEGVKSARFISTGGAGPDAVTPGADPVSPGASRSVELNESGAVVSVDIPPFPDEWELTDRFVTTFVFKHGDEATSTDLARFRMNDSTGFVWQLLISTSSGGDQLDLVLSRWDSGAGSPPGTTLDTASVDIADFYYMEFRKFTNTFEFRVNSSTVMNGTISLPETVGAPVRNTIRALTDPDQILVGHFATWAIGDAILTVDAMETADIPNALNGYDAEPAGRRAERLCLEEGIPFYGIGDLDDTSLMGSQLIDDFIGLMVSCQEADAGILFESRDQAGLAYRTRMSLYNQDATLGLDQESCHLAVPFEANEDDQFVRNDVTVTRSTPHGSGESVRLVKEQGALSVAEVGRYNDDIDANLHSPLQLPNHASWRVHLGTVDEFHYPTIRVRNIVPRNCPPDPELTEQAAEVDIGDLISIDAPPPQLPPNQVIANAQGYREHLDLYEWDLRFATTPASPYIIGVRQEDSPGPGPADPGRRDTAGSVLDSQFVAGTDASFDVQTTLGILWGQTGNSNMHFPFDLNISGARVRVTAIGAPTGQVQTFTCEQTIVNGVDKTISAGADVRLWQPAVRGL